MLKAQIKKIITNTLKCLDIGVTRFSELERLKKNVSAIRDLDILQKLNNGNSEDLLRCFKDSKSQLRQDLFALSHLGFKRNGYFVEFGAASGVDLSNTYLMEKEFGWKGILAEPAICWHDNLKIKRSCHIETDCVWQDSGSILTFNEVDVAELSTISLFTDIDSHSSVRKKGKSYEVKTVSLNDLLKKYKAPKNIDYLSIDTEGSEYQILSNFDFSQYSFGVITCEHNYTPLREQLYLLLTRNGYNRVFAELSLFDDWYIKPSQILL